MNIYAPFSRVNSLKESGTRAQIHIAHEGGADAILMDFDSKGLTDWSASWVKDYVALYLRMMGEAHALGLKVIVCNFNETKADRGHKVSIPVLNHISPDLHRAGQLANLTIPQNGIADLPDLEGLYPQNVYGLTVKADRDCTIFLEGSKYKSQYILKAGEREIQLISLDEPNWTQNRVKAVAGARIIVSHATRESVHNLANGGVLKGSTGWDYIGKEGVSGFFQCRAATPDPRLCWADRLNQIGRAYEVFGKHPAFYTFWTSRDELSAYVHGQHEWADQVAITDQYIYDLTGVKGLSHGDMFCRKHNAKEKSRTIVGGMRDVFPSVHGNYGIWNEPRWDYYKADLEDFNNWEVDCFPMAINIESATAWGTVLKNRTKQPEHKMVYEWNFANVTPDWLRTMFNKMNNQ